MTLRELRDNLNDLIESDGYGSCEIDDDFSIFDHFKEEGKLTYVEAIGKIKWIKSCIETIDTRKKQILQTLDF